MIIEILVLASTLVIGFAGGALVYRNNAKKAETLIQAMDESYDAYKAVVEARIDRLNDELRAALDELEAAKAKLSRKPKATA